MRSKISEMFKNSIIPSIILIALVLAGLFAYTLASYLAAPPSDGFSRETPISQVAYGDSRIVKSHVTSIQKNNELITTIAVDGHQTTIITNDMSGSVTDTLSLGLDLFKSKQVDAYYEDDTTLVIYYITDALYKTVINTSNSNMSNQLLKENVRSFAASGQELIIVTEEGMSLIDTSGTTELTLIEGTFRSYQATKENNTWYVMYTKVNGFTYDLEIATVQDDSLDITTLASDERSSALEFIHDIHIQDSLLTGIAIHTNERDGLNYINAIQYDLNTNTLLPMFEVGFPIHDSRYTLTNTGDGQFSMLLQLPFRGGINIAEATVTDSGISSIKYLTKTHGLSKLSGYISTDNDTGLVFLDRVEDKRHILFASTNSKLIAETTNLSTIDPLNILTITIFASLMGLFIWSIPYLLLAGGLPTVLSLMLSKFFGKDDMKPEKYDLIPAVLMTGLKLYFTWHLIHQMGNYIVRPAFIGQEPIIYIALIITSIISYMLFIKSHKHAKGDAITVSAPFISYVGADLIQYSMLVFTYISLNMIVDKV